MYIVIAMLIMDKYIRLTRPEAAVNLSMPSCCWNPVSKAPIFPWAKFTIPPTKNTLFKGQGKNTKLRVSSYFNIYGRWVILG